MLVEYPRVDWRPCGKGMEAVSWLDRYARVTKRLADAVIKTCQELPPRCSDCTGVALKVEGNTALAIPSNLLLVSVELEKLALSGGH